MVKAGMSGFKLYELTGILTMMQLLLVPLVALDRYGYDSPNDAMATVSRVVVKEPEQLTWDVFTYSHCPSS
jgi:hypothetical protein